MACYLIQIECLMRFYVLVKFFFALMLPDVTKFFVFFELFPSMRFFFWSCQIIDRLDILLSAMFCIRKHKWTYQFFGEKIMVLNNSTNLLADCNEIFLTLFVVIFIIEHFFWIIASHCDLLSKNKIIDSLIIDDS